MSKRSNEEIAVAEGGTVKVTLPITPLGKPRMTQRDKWGSNKRPCVARYHAYRDHIRLLAPQLPPDPYVLSAICYFPFPKSYTMKRKNKMAGEMHRQKPDADNVLKGLADALFPEDKGISDMSIKKRWDDGQGARIELEVL